MTISPQHYDAVSDAFGRKALVYDAFGEDHIQLSRMRQKVYDHVQAVTPRNGYLLEINAGTGTDATHLVQQGYRVHATDLSPGMIAKAKQKVDRYQLEDRLSVQLCSFTELNKVTAGPFDGVYSNFGGLNCIPDLRAVTCHLPALLKPNGTVTWVVMPRICPWEMALYAKDSTVATRRFVKGGTPSHVEGVFFDSYYFSVRETVAAFGSRFEVQKLEGLAIFTPSADNKTFAKNHPLIYKALTQIDDAICHTPPFNRWGDFFILTMRFTG